MTAYSGIGCAHAGTVSCIISAAPDFGYLAGSATIYQWRKNMSIFAWIVLGVIAGFIGSKIVNKRGDGLVLDLVLGIVGAVAGGWLFNLFGASGVTGLNFYSLAVAVVGAIVVLVVYHAIRRAA
jgi:uncharacterized membrane protein YeaQ/YmgE (transglycosylase-associated protein family)